MMSPAMQTPRLASLTSSSRNRRPPRKVFRCRNTWKSLGSKSGLEGGGDDGIVPSQMSRCGDSVWAGIVMKHQNTTTKYATSLTHVVSIRKHLRLPAWTQFPKTKFVRHNFMMKWPSNLWEMYGKWRNG
jgi:hypothetical protein